MDNLLQVGRQVKINVYGQVYDGEIAKITDDTITIVEACGSSNLYKILYRKNIAAIETRVFDDTAGLI